METENDNQIATLDILMEKKNDGHLGHSVYKNTTNTNSYLNDDTTIRLK